MTNFLLFLILVALVSINVQLKRALREDFSREDASVKETTKDVMSAEHAVHDAEGRVPH